MKEIIPIAQLNQDKGPFLRYFQDYANLLF